MRRNRLCAPLLAFLSTAAALPVDPLYRNDTIFPASPLLSSPPASLSPSRRSLRKRGATKAVFAHVVQGDFQGYGQDDYAADYKLAMEAGIAAFAMNVGNDGSDGDQMKKAFAAAEASSFSLFFSFDMNYFGKSGSADTILNNYLVPYGKSSAHYAVDGKVLVSTFSGEVAGTFLDGAGSLEDSMSKWKTTLDSAADSIGKEISFAPDWNDVSLVSQQTYGGGIMSWAAWGDKGRTGDMTTSGDESYLSAASSAGLYYIAPVAAFFFVHVAAGNNYVLQNSDFLLPNHYSDLIGLDSGPTFIELLSWNDFGEAHYLGPVRSSAGVPSTATAYATSDHDHLPMLWLSAYYNLWFAKGSPPSIKTETIVWYHRPHPASASASSDSLDKPEYAETLEDKIYAVVFVPSGSKAASLVITTGGKTTDAQKVQEGVNLLSVDFSTGATRVSLQDSDGKELLSGTGTDISGSPSTYDFNYYSYIIPEDATASTFLDGTSSSTTTTTNKGNTTQQSTSPSSSSAKAQGSTAAQSGGGGSTKSAASASKSASGSSPTSGSDGSSSSPSSSSGGSSGSSSDSGGDSSSDTDLTSFVTTSYFGLPAWGWIIGVLVLALVGVCAYMCASHGRTAPAPISKKRSADGTSSEESETESDTGGDSDDSGGGRKHR